MALSLALVTLLLAVVVHDLVQRKYAILRNFPIVGHFRYWLESVGPELRQYIVTSNTEERPFSRDQRRWVYASAKLANNYFGFGSDHDMELTPNYLIIKHQVFPRRTLADRYGLLRLSRTGRALQHVASRGNDDEPSERASDRDSRRSVRVENGGRDLRRARPGPSAERSGENSESNRSKHAAGRGALFPIGKAVAQVVCSAEAGHMDRLA